MALRPQTSALIVDLLAIGVLRVGTAGELFGPDNTVFQLPGAGQRGRVTASPLTGATVAALANNLDQTLYITPAGTIAALTVNMPADAVSQIGQQVQVTTSQIITTLTLGQTGGGATILGNVTTLAAGATIILTKQAANTWSVK